MSTDPLAALRELDAATLKLMRVDLAKRLDPNSMLLQDSELQIVAIDLEFERRAILPIAINDAFSPWILGGDSGALLMRGLIAQDTSSQRLVLRAARLTYACAMNESSRQMRRAMNAPIGQVLQ